MPKLHWFWWWLWFDFDDDDDDDDNNYDDDDVDDDYVDNDDGKDDDDADDDDKDWGLPVVAGICHAVTHPACIANDNVVTIFVIVFWPRSKNLAAKISTRRPPVAAISICPG